MCSTVLRNLEQPLYEELSTTLPFIVCVYLNSRIRTEMCFSAISDPLLALCAAT